VKKLSKSTGDHKSNQDEMGHSKSPSKKAVSKFHAGNHDSRVSSSQRDDLDNSKSEKVQSRERHISGGTSKKSPLNRKEKHNREVQALLLMDAMLEQMAKFTSKEKIVDFAKVFF